MTRPARPRAVGFHDGELAVQRRAGVAAAAARLSGMLEPAELRGGLTRFLAARTFAALTARDQAGRLWISPLAGNAPSTRALRPACLPGRSPRYRPAVDPAAALLFCDFATGQTLHLSGTATVDWTAPGVPGDDGGTGRRVHFTPQALVAGRLLPLHADTVTASPDNPALTDPPGLQEVMPAP